MAGACAAPVFAPGSTAGEFTFDTGVLRGKLHASGKSIGLSEVVHVPSGRRLDRSMGLFSIYRVFTRAARFGTGAWDWPSDATLRDDGSVEINWRPDRSRPFHLQATYRWRDESTVGMETAVTPSADLAGFEVFLASYFSESFSNALVYARAAAGDVSPILVPVGQRAGTWQIFPRDAAAVSVISDGRWRINPNPIEWAIQPEYALPLAIRRHPVSGLGALIMAPMMDCFAVATPHQTEPHYSTYLCLFGRDLKSGSTVRARAALAFTGKFSEGELKEIYGRCVGPPGPKQ